MSQYYGFHSFFKNLFGFNKDKPEEKKEEPGELQKSTLYHKDTLKKQVKTEKKGKKDIKLKIRSITREGPDNLYGRYPR